ncbi:MAG: oxidoreductase [Phycisphaerae bacterium]
MRGFFRAALLAAVPWLAGSGCPLTGPIDSGEPRGTRIDIQEYVAAAAFPTALAVAPDGRVFYTEKETGRVRVVSAAGELRPEPFAEVPVVSLSERGLLGIALHPDFEQNGYVYLFYTRSAAGAGSSLLGEPLDNRVVRFRAAGDVADGPETLILSLPATPGPNHNAGHLAFGPDRKLYVSLGDLAVSARAQDLDSPAGRILRLNDDGSVPDNNPFGAGNPTYCLGLRNSFGLAFDPVSGALWATENGTSNHDEVNRLIAGGNCGWPLVQGFVESPPAVAAGTYVNPAVDYSEGSVVPTGIAFAPDAVFGAASRHQLFVAQYRTGRILRYTLNEARDGVIEEAVFAQAIADGITDLAFGPDGHLFVATGRQILRIVPVP